jgi:hypothetical protein
LYGLLSIALGIVCFLNEIIWKNQVARHKTKFFRLYKFLLGIMFFIGGLYILRNKP